MKQELEELHVTTNGLPDGGETTATGLAIFWQRGSLGRGEERKEPNGCFVETVIEAAVGRLRYYQTTQFNCQENAEAIGKLESALEWLAKRTAAREARQVEGTHEA